MVQTLDRDRIGDVRQCSRLVGGFDDADFSRRVNDGARRRVCSTPVPATRARATALRRGAAIEVQESAEPRVSCDDAIAARHRELGFDQPIPDSLVRTLPVVVLRVFGVGVPQRARADEYHAVETVAPDWADQRLRVGVAARQHRRSEGWRSPGSIEGVPGRSGHAMKR